MQSVSTIDSSTNSQSFSNSMEKIFRVFFFHNGSLSITTFVIFIVCIWKNSCDFYSHSNYFTHFLSAKQSFEMRPLPILPNACSDFTLLFFFYSTSLPFLLEPKSAKNIFFCDIFQVFMQHYIRTLEF